MVEYVILRFLLLLNGEVLENSSETPNRDNTEIMKEDGITCYVFCQL